MNVTTRPWQTGRRPFATVIRSTAEQPADDGAVAFRQVTKRYGEVTALDRVDLQILRAETVALLGPNGAGKSTAIGLMLGLLDPTNGTVRTLGLAPREAVADGRVGAMLQSSGLPTAAHVDEFLEFVRRLYRRPLALSSIVQRAGLGGLERRAIETLSGGELQRLRFGLAIAGDPDLLFLDEPTVGMDVETRRAFWTDMRAYGEQGRTVLFATHYLEEADAIADRIIVLNHGRVIADGTPRSIKERVTTRTVTLHHAERLGSRSRIDRGDPGRPAVARLGDQVRITTTDADTVVRSLVELGLTLRDLEVRGAALEDAFVALTSDDESGRIDLPKGDN